ncbi:MAG: M20/M25/M40 family metallo-hydrolase, partial [Microbacteriaceae bacterium]
LVTQLQVMITRKFNVFEPVVISVTRLSAGEAVNVIPPSASLSATVRTVTQTSLDALPGFIEELASGIASAHGCTAEVNFETQYIPTVNDPAETEFAIETLREQFGEDLVQVPPHGVMGSEDFSYVLHEIPGTFYMLSATPDGIDPMSAANHSPLVQFDDAVLSVGAASLAQLALARLAK